MFSGPVTLLILVVFSSSATVESLNATATVECGVNATSTVHVGCDANARATVECRVNATVDVGCGSNTTSAVACPNDTTATATLVCGMYAATVECRINRTETLECSSTTATATATTTATATVSPSNVSISLTDWRAKDGECEKCHEGGGGPFDIVRTCEPENSSQCKNVNTTLLKDTSKDCPKYCPSNAVAITVSSLILAVGIFLSSFREF